MPKPELTEEQRQRLEQWARSLEQTNPDRWEYRVSQWMEELNTNREAAIEHLVHVRMESGNYQTGVIPPEVVWNGKSSFQDQICPWCQVVGLPGLMRFLGTFYAGKVKVAQSYWDEDVEVSRDVEHPYFLTGWRCDVCGNEETSD